MILEARNLSFHKKNRSLISDISLTFYSGKLYGIIGPNGSGKTTFLKNLSGIWPATSGSIFWCNNQLINLPRNEVSRIISFVPHASFIPFDYSVLEIVEMGRYSHGNKNNSPDLIRHVLHLVDIWHLRHRPLTQLSSGERQRVYIARALATEAPIILLDEPTSHLDLRHQLEIWNLLNALISKDRIVIAAIHDLHAAKRYCNEIAVLNYGQCISHGQYSTVITEELMKNVFGVSCQKDERQTFEPIP